MGMFYTQFWQWYITHVNSCSIVWININNIVFVMNLNPIIHVHWQQEIIVFNRAGLSTSLFVVNKITRQFVKITRGVPTWVAPLYICYDSALYNCFNQPKQFWATQLIHPQKRCVPMTAQPAMVACATECCIIYQHAISLGCIIQSK